MPTGTDVNSLRVPRARNAETRLRPVPKKNPEDHEIERRVRAHIRREMVERQIGVNEAGRRLGVKEGTLSRILSESRGFGSGFILRVQRAFKIPAKMLLEEDPADPALLAPGVPGEPPTTKRPRGK
jgi:hypothetical protein